MSIPQVQLSRYAKAYTAAVGQLLVYLQLYGATWHLVPAVTAIAVILGVYGVPNTPKSDPAGDPAKGQVGAPIGP